MEQLKLNNEVSLNEATQTMDTNPIKTAITVCNQLIQRQVRLQPHVILLASVTRWFNKNCAQISEKIAKYKINSS